MAERTNGESRPKILLDSMIHTPKSLNRLLAGGQDVSEKAREQIGSYSSEESTELVVDLFDGVSRDDRQWDQDKRDGALEILQMIDYEKIENNTLFSLYRRAVDRQNRYGDPDPHRPLNIDPNGSVASVLEAGKIIAPHLSLSLRDKGALAD